MRIRALGKLDGPVFTIPTPFDRAGKVDFGALQDLVAFIGRSGAQCVVTNGTTSEFSSLTLEERRLILESVRTQFSGVVINHIGSCCVQDSVSLLDHSYFHADAVLALPPYFLSGVSEEGVQAFWRQIFPASSMPIFLYNFPEHTQLNLRAEFVSKVAGEFEAVRGIKDSGSDFQLSVKFRHAREGFDVFVGGEGRTVDALRRGLNGAVCGLGNALPELQLAMHRSFRAGRVEQACELQHIYDTWLDFRRRFSVNPAELVKAGIAARLPGFPRAVRPPLLALSESLCGVAADLLSRILSSYEQLSSTL